MFKLDLEKAEEPEIKLPTSPGSSKKQESQKYIYFCYIDYAKAFVVVNKAKVAFFLELSCFFSDPTDAGDLISGSSPFFKIQLEHLEAHGSHIVEA